MLVAPTPIYHFQCVEQTADMLQRDSKVVTGCSAIDPGLVHWTEEYTRHMSRMQRPQSILCKPDSKAASRQQHLTAAQGESQCPSHGDALIATSAKLIR